MHLWAYDPRSAQDRSTSSEKCTPGKVLVTKAQTWWKTVLTCSISASVSGFTCDQFHRISPRSSFSQNFLSPLISENFCLSSISEKNSRTSFVDVCECIYINNIHILISQFIVAFNSICFCCDVLVYYKWYFSFMKVKFYLS